MGLEELDRMPPRVRQKYLEIIRAIPPGRKIEIAAELGDAMRALVLDSIRDERPGASEEEIRHEFLRRTVPADLYEKICARRKPR
jgi:hypothetical protein